MAKSLIGLGGRNVEALFIFLNWSSQFVHSSAFFYKTGFIYVKIFCCEFYVVYEGFFCFISWVLYIIDWVSTRFMLNDAYLMNNGNDLSPTLC